MTLVKKLTKEDLVEFEKNLEEYIQASMKFINSSQGTLYAGSLGAACMFDNHWVQIAQQCATARAVNKVQIANFDNLEKLDAEQKREYIAKFLLASKLAAACTPERSANGNN